MSGENIPIKFQLRSGVFSEQQIRAEINGLKGTTSYRNVMDDISGKIPQSLGHGKNAIIKNFIITDDTNLAGEKTANVPGFSFQSSNGDFVIFLNPNIVKFDPTTGRSLTIGELIVHELGHATDAGFAALLQDMLTYGNGNASERIAYRYESDLAAEKGLAPIPNARSADSFRQRQQGEVPAYLTNVDPGCFLAGTAITLGGRYYKKIEDVKVGDSVLAFDGHDSSTALSEHRVTRTFSNIAKTVVDLRGVFCTPGHVFCMGDKDADGYSRFATIGRILRGDETLVEQDGDVIRARTGAKLGSGEDALVKIVYRVHATAGMPGAERRALVRAGIPMPATTLADGKSQAPAGTLAGHLQGHGVTILPDGNLRTPDGTHHAACNWPEGATLFDTHESRNWIVEVDGEPYTPPWIRDLVEEDEHQGLRVVGALQAAG